MVVPYIFKTHQKQLILQYFFVANICLKCLCMHVLLSTFKSVSCWTSSSGAACWPCMADGVIPARNFTPIIYKGIIFQFKNWVSHESSDPEHHHYLDMAHIQTTNNCNAHVTTEQQCTKSVSEITACTIPYLTSHVLYSKSLFIRETPWHPTKWAANCYRVGEHNGIALR